MPDGSLPDFVIVGEMKTGTTSLAYYLDAHPRVHVSPTRPVRFFDERFDRGLDWYRAQFAGRPDGAIAGDDTPNYLFDPVAIERLAATLPDAKLVVMLRDPVERAWSHYWHHDRDGFDTRGFVPAVEHELTHGVGERGTPEGSGYVGRGRYVEGIRRLHRHFAPSAVHVDFHESLRADTGATFARICRFLGVDDTVRPDNLETVYNVGWTPTRRRLNRAMYRFRLWEMLPRRAGQWVARNTTAFVRDVEMDEAIKHRLATHYESADRELEALVGPLPWRS